MSQPVIRIVLALPDVEAGLAFYRAALPTTSGPAAHALDLGARVRLELQRESAPPSDAERSERRRVPRLECVIDDLEAALARFLAAGGTLRARVSPGYAHVIDPFGYLWALQQS